MAITFTALDYTGTPTADEARAALDIINEENARRAAATPPGTPLPTGTNAQKKTSYITCLLQNNVQKAHESYVARVTKIDWPVFKTAYESANQATRDSVLAALGIT